MMSVTMEERAVRLATTHQLSAICTELGGLLEDRAIRLAAERRLAAEQEETRRQLAELLERVRHMEVLVHRLLNELQGDGR